MHADAGMGLEGVQVSIRALPYEAPEQLREGDDLLARWCHAGSLPCDGGRCTTPKAVEAKLSEVYQGSAELKTLAAARKAG